MTKKTSPLSNVPGGKAGVIAAIAFAYFCRYHIDVLICALPKYIDGYFVRLVYSRNRKNSNLPNPKVPNLSKTPYYTLPLEDVKDVLDVNGYPRLIEDYAVVDHDKTIGMLHKMNAGRQMRMLDTEGIWKEHHFSPSCNRLTADSKTMVAFDDFAGNHLFKKHSNNHSALYAGFESITDPETLDELLGVDIRGFGDYKQNNLFASNFEKPTLAASMHCAPIDSVSIQLIGTKIWFFVSPEDLAKVPNVPMPTAFPLPITDDELLAAVSNIHVVTQKPGDLVSFGPNWCHAVLTLPGPNLMFNLRFFANKKLRMGPKSLLLKVVMRVYTRTIEGRPQDNEKVYPILFKDLTEYYTDCGQSEAMNKIVQLALDM